MRSYNYRFHPPESPSYERCVGYWWCPECRLFEGTMVFVPRDEQLPDALAPLPPDERDRVRRSERRLIAHVNRLMDRGEYP